MLPSLVSLDEKFTVEAVRRRHLEAVARTLAFLAGNEDATADAVEQLMRLRGESLVRVLSAPESNYRVALGCDPGGSPVGPFVRESTEVERCVAGDQDTSDKGGWSALGDRYVPPAWTADGGGGSPLVFDPAQPYTAPSVAELPVDFASPWSRRPMRAARRRRISLQACDPFPLGAVSDVLRRLGDAIAVLEAVDPATAQIVRCVVEVIQLRHAAEHPDLFTSASTRGQVGRVILVNPHLCHVDSLRLANALVHEATHSHLYHLEEAEPFVTPSPEAQAVDLRSPWTGGSLGLHTYVHAVIVWYRLASFWQLATEAGLGCEAEKLRREAMAGFVDGDPTEQLRRHSTHLRDDVLPTLTECVQLARSELS